MRAINGLVAIFFFCIFVFLSHKQYILAQKTKNRHGENSMFGTALIGGAMFTFRLVRGFRSWFVKYIHMITALVGCYYLFVGYGTLVIKDNDDKDKDKDKDTLLFKNIHAYPGYVLYGVLIAHVLLAILIFVFIAKYNARFSYSALHDIFGVWLFTQLVGCCLAGMQAVDPANTKLKYTKDTISFNEITVANFILTTFVVLNPFFEWDMVEHI